MPKVSWGLDADNEPEAMEGFAVYDGDKPPAGQVYTVKLKRLGVKLNKNDDKMINGLLEIAEPKGSSKAKYNGYPVWFNQNVTQQGAPFLKNILDAFGVSWKDFNTKTVMGEGELSRTGVVPILKLGGLKVENEPTIRIVGKDNPYNGTVSLQPGQYLPPKDEVDVEEDDDDESDEEDAF